MFYYHLILALFAILIALAVGVDLFGTARKKHNNSIIIISYAFFAAAASFVIHFTFETIMPLKMIEELDFPILFYIVVLAAIRLFAFRLTWKMHLEKPSKEDEKT